MTEDQNEKHLCDNVTSRVEGGGNTGTNWLWLEPCDQHRVTEKHGRAGNTVHNLPAYIKE